MWIDNLVFEFAEQLHFLYNVYISSTYCVHESYKSVYLVKNLEK